MSLSPSPIGLNHAMKTYSINIAQSIRSYGSVMVKAEDIDAAIAKVDADYVVANFTPHGHGDDDFDWMNPTAISLTAIELEESGDAEGEEETPRELLIELPDTYPNLAYLSTDEAKLIVAALLALPSEGMDAEAAKARDTMRLHLANTLLDQMQALAAIPAATASDAIQSAPSASIHEGAHA